MAITAAWGQFPDPPANCPRSAKQAHIWYFGEKAGMDFNAGSAIPLTNQNVMLAMNASSVISDSLGNILFLTNGRKVYDRTFSIMPNATELYGNLGATQPCIIVPLPGFSHIFYLFTLDMAFVPNPQSQTKGLTYSIVDMTLRNGLGDATDMLNLPLLKPVCSKITAVKHGNGKDFWILAHKFNSNEFYAYLLTSSGLSDPVISATGTTHDGSQNDNNYQGYMKFSPDGSRLALTIPGKNIVEAFTFNNLTGSVSAPLSHTFSVPGVKPFGLEFSSDSKKLYTSVLQLNAVGPPTNPSYIYQFDCQGDFSSPILVATIPGVLVTTMQLAVDGRIYLTRTITQTIKIDSLDVIYNPTRPGVECNYNKLDGNDPVRFPLLGRNAFYSLPNFMQSYFDIPVFTWDSCCHQDITRFHITNKANIDQVIWNFGDNSTSTDLDPVHQFAHAGIYKVALTQIFNGMQFTDTVAVTIHPKPFINLGDTVFLYEGSVINLHAGGGFQEYLWSTGATDSIINVSTQGEYWAKVKDWHCCINADTTLVNVFHFFTPTAFTPNGDGLNDVFRVIGLYRNIDLELFIYDRWGKMVFKSNQIDDGWDGKIGNKPAAPDTYVWKAYIRFLGQDIITQGNIVLSGTVTLVR